MSSIFSSGDTNLIEKFVQGSNQLLATERVRMETTGHTSQMITRTGEVVAVMHFQNQPRTALVKAHSMYADLLESKLQEHDFILIGQSKRPGYLEYCQYVVPAGYKVFYTEPALLWKKWWPTERFKNKQRFNMNILVRMKDNWYPVQNIVIDAGTFTVKTLAGQVEVGGSEQILWLSQIPQEDIGDSTAAHSDAWDYARDVSNVPNQPYTNAVNSSVLNAVSNPPLSSAVVPPAPPNLQKKIQELEMRLYKQQQSTIAAEQRAIRAEQRAEAAEKQLALLKAQAPKEELEINWIH